MTNHQYRKLLRKIDKDLSLAWAHCRDNSDDWNRISPVEHNFPHQGGMICAAWRTIESLINLCDIDTGHGKEEM